MHASPSDEFRYPPPGEWNAKGTRRSPWNRRGKTRLALGRACGVPRIKPSPGPMRIPGPRSIGVAVLDPKFEIGHLDRKFLGGALVPLYHPKGKLIIAGTKGGRRHL